MKRRRMVVRRRRQREKMSKKGKTIVIKSDLWPPELRRNHGQYRRKLCSFIAFLR